MHLQRVDQIDRSIVIYTKSLFSSILSKRSAVPIKFDGVVIEYPSCKILMDGQTDGQTGRQTHALSPFNYCQG